MSFNQPLEESMATQDQSTLTPGSQRNEQRRSTSRSVPTRGVGELMGWGLLVACLSSGAAYGIDPCRILVVDESNGWPVPLVELKTTHNLRFVTDNAGTIALDAPELLDRETWFHLEGHGYSVAKDGFGFQGVRLVPRSGETLTVKVHRQLAAKRLGCLTGGGIFAESQKLGLELDWVDQGVFGCDSVQNAVHDGRMFWNWGDTVLHNYPLGRFHMTGATTEIEPLESFEPPVRLRYRYFTDEAGTVRNVAEMPGDGPTWLGGYASLPDQTQRHRLVATYTKIDPPLDTYELGLCVWNDQLEKFEKTQVLWQKSDAAPTPPPAPMGHAIPWRDASGKQWVLFGDPFPSIQLEPTFEAWSDPSRWQQLKPQEWVAVKGSDQQIQPHRGSVAWSGYRGRWVTVFTQLHGEPSLLGEIWYAEADAPTGPWKDAVKVVTHADYTFYNPKLHPEFTAADSPVLLFEGTYTHTFSGNSRPTPRYDYNQVLYRLDLDELAPKAADSKRANEDEDRADQPAGVNN